MPEIIDHPVTFTSVQFWWLRKGEMQQLRNVMEQLRKAGMFDVLKKEGLPDLWQRTEAGHTEAQSLLDRWRIKVMVTTETRWVCLKCQHHTSVFDNRCEKCGAFKTSECKRVEVLGDQVNPPARMEPQHLINVQRK